MINKLPILGWIISFLASASVAVPFWYLWTCYGLGEKYFYFLPAVFQNIGFYDSVGLFVIVSILRPALTPQFASVSNSNTNE